MKRIICFVLSVGLGQLSFAQSIPFELGVGAGSYTSILGFYAYGGMRFPLNGTLSMTGGLDLMTESNATHTAPDEKVCWRESFISVLFSLEKRFLPACRVAPYLSFGIGPSFHLVDGMSASPACFFTYDQKIGLSFGKHFRMGIDLKIAPFEGKETVPAAYWYFPFNRALFVSLLF